jgi:hypothetical protein
MIGYTVVLFLACVSKFGFRFIMVILYKVTVNEWCANLRVPTGFVRRSECGIGNTALQSYSTRILPLHGSAPDLTGRISLKLGIYVSLTGTENP